MGMADVFHSDENPMPAIERRQMEAWQEDQRRRQEAHDAMMREYYTAVLAVLLRERSHLFNKDNSCQAVKSIEVTYTDGYQSDLTYWPGEVNALVTYVGTTKNGKPITKRKEIYCGDDPIEFGASVWAIKSQPEWLGMAANLLKLGQE